VKHSFCSLQLQGQLVDYKVEQCVINTEGNGSVLCSNRPILWALLKDDNIAELIKVIKLIMLCCLIHVTDKHFLPT